MLRRRFFKPDRSAIGRRSARTSWRRSRASSTSTSRPRKDIKGAEDRLLKSYPFHPDLTEIFYTKWTQLEGFQRTRGILRTFALALRDAEQWDTRPARRRQRLPRASRGSPASPRAPASSPESPRQEEYEGKQQEWSAILEGELAKAREIQAEAPGLKHREMEQAVFATFLHSQPHRQKALTRDLMLLVGPTRPDRIELEKALLRGPRASWFLDEARLPTWTRPRRARERCRSRGASATGPT